MTDLRKAAEMALEAFEMYLQHSTKEMIFNQIATARAKALRQALAQPEQESVKESFNSKTGIKEALNLDRGCWERGCMAYDERDGDGVNISAERVDETVKREHEPFIYVREDNERPFGGYEHCSEADVGAFPVYTAPPKREWVGLTDEEIYDYADKFLYSHGSNYGIKSFGKAIEAKLKERNSG